MAVCFEDVEVGQTIPSLTKGPMTTAHIMRWSAAMENWHPIHFDWRFATQEHKLPDVIVNGSWKQHVMLQLVADWAGETGWPWKVRFQFRGMNVPGDLLSDLRRSARTIAASTRLFCSRRGRISGDDWPYRAWFSRSPRSLCRGQSQESARLPRPILC